MHEFVILKTVMQNLARRLTTFLRSNTFFWVIIGGFILQCLLFAVVVSPSTVETHADGQITRGGGVVPDGNRHIAAIYYFADQPLLDGPIIRDMDSNAMWIGDLERFPSYFYYYLLSFPVRIAMMMGAPDALNVLLIRLIGIVFGVIVLLTLRKIVREIGLGRVSANIIMLAMAATGAFAWLTPAENYDILGLMFWLLFLLTSLRLFIRRDAKYLYWMALWFCLVSISKYTYIPFAGLSGLVAFWLYARRLGYQNTVATIKMQARNWAKQLKKYQIAGLVILLLVPAVLFAERIGGNLLFYRSFSPSCTQIHSLDDCMKFGVFARNYTRAQEYDRQLEAGEVERTTYNPVTYTGFWLNRYYSSMYGYVGHIWIYEFWPVMYAGMIGLVAAAAALFVYLKRRRIRVLQSAAEKYIAGVVVLLVVAQYVFNVRTFVTFGGEMYAYAHQGRYLLSAIGLIYILLLLVAYRAVAAMQRKTRRVVVPILVAIGLFAFVTNCALVSFFVHADTAEWYSDIGRQIVPDWVYKIN